jgi:hypothetical protein
MFEVITEFTTAAAAATTTSTSDITTHMVLP